MTLVELQEKVAEDNDAVMKSLLVFGSQIPGTKAYFGQESKKAISMERWIRIMSGGKEMFNIFLTFSLPHLHMEELHRLLPGSDKYLGKTIVANMNDIPPGSDPSLYIDEKTDFKLRSSALAKNGHLVDYFGNRRLNTFIDKILINVFGMADYLIRCEYQSRKAIHWHMAARIIGVSMDDLVRSAKKYDFDVKDSSDEEQMTALEREEERIAFIQEGIIVDHPNTEEFKEEVAQGRRNVIDFVTKDLGLSACHPQSDPKLWPGPEGQNVNKPPTNCLRTPFLKVSDQEQDYELLVNRVQLHGCRLSYCLRKILELLRCRFGYPITLKGFINQLLTSEGSSILNEVLRLDDFKCGAAYENGKLQFLRNHPRFVMHIPELLPIWRGNIDQKLIDSPQHLLKYVLKYLLKPEEGSLAFTDIIKTLTSNAASTTPIRKIFQKILLKTVSEHDISKNECWKIVSGEPYVIFSRPFRYLNLTGSRRVVTESTGDGGQSALAKNFCDLYWQRDNDENYSEFVKNYETGLIAFLYHPRDISLYMFSSCCTNKWQPSKKLFIPKPTPCFKYVPIQDNVQYRKVYCETSLLLHKPGTYPNNILENHASLEEAMNDFASNDSRCPKVIKQEYLASLNQNVQPNVQLNDNIEDLVASPGSQNVNISQDDWMQGLGEEIRQQDIDDPEPDIGDEDDGEDIEFQEDEDADWSLDRRILELSDQDIDDAQDWIARMKVSADLNLDDELHIHPESLNIEQKIIFEEMMSVLQSENEGSQRLIDVSGGAGTGKSYLIKAILQQAQAMSGHRNSVRICAPTGCAASQFANGQTIHALLKIPPKQGCGELDDLTGGSLAGLQDTFKHTRALILDEKGMLGLGRMQQINARLKQARPNNSDLPFGGISILLAG